MHYKILSILLLSVAALALSPSEADERNASLLAKALGVPPSNIPTITMPPESIATVLKTAIPSGFYSNGPAEELSILKGAVTSEPEWYKSLPASVQTYLASYASYVESEASKAGLFTALPASTSSSTTSATGIDTSQPNSQTGTSKSGSASQIGASSSTSTGGGAPTAGIAAGFVGAMGILGLAAAL